MVHARLFTQLRTRVRTGSGARAVVAGALAAGVVFAGAGAARADSAPVSVSHSIGDGGCTATLELTGTDEDYAHAQFSNFETNYTCVFWLERSVYSNGSWSAYTPIGSYGTNPDEIGPQTGGGGEEIDTGSYWDGPDNRVRAVFYMINYSTMTGNYYTVGI